MSVKFCKLRFWLQLTSGLWQLRDVCGEIRDPVEEGRARRVGLAAKVRSLLRWDDWWLPCGDAVGFPPPQLIPGPDQAGRAGTGAAIVRGVLGDKRRVVARAPGFRTGAERQGLPLDRRRLDQVAALLCPPIENWRSLSADLR